MSPCVPWDVRTDFNDSPRESQIVFNWIRGGAKIVIWTKHTTVVNQKQLLASVFLGKSRMKSQNQECFENIVFMGQGAGNPPKLCLIFLLTKTDYFPVQLHHSCKFLL